MKLAKKLVCVSWLGSISNGKNKTMKVRKRLLEDYSIVVLLMETKSLCLVVALCTIGRDSLGKVLIK